MKHYSYYGYNEFILALGYKGDHIRNYFLNYHTHCNDFSVDTGTGNVELVNFNKNENWKVTLVETGLNSLTSYRTKLCQKYINDDNFMLTYGDAVSDLNLDRLINFHNQQDTLGTVTAVYPPSRFGDLVVDKNIVEEF